MKDLDQVKRFLRNLPIVYQVRKFFSYPMYNKIRSLLHVMDVQGMTYKRLGKNGDGGYVVADCLPSDTIVYSFGIANDVSFEKDIANMGFGVYMYDHTIENLPEKHPTFNFFKLGIAGKSSSENLKTMDELLAINRHTDENNLFLKMDVEGAEWDFLNNAKPETMLKFSQMVFEFHHLVRLSRLPQIESALIKLNETHQLVHVHANNCGAYKEFDGIIYPKLLEVTYLRKEHKFIESNRTFPTQLDQPNNEIVGTDYNLGCWNVS